MEDIGIGNEVCRDSWNKVAQLEMVGSHRGDEPIIWDCAPVIYIPIWDIVDGAIDIFSISDDEVFLDPQEGKSLRE